LPPWSPWPAIRKTAAYIKTASAGVPVCPSAAIRIPALGAVGTATATVAVHVERSQHGHIAVQVHPGRAPPAEHGRGCRSTRSAVVWGGWGRPRTHHVVHTRDGNGVRWHERRQHAAGGAVGRVGGQQLCAAVARAPLVLGMDKPRFQLRIDLRPPTPPCL
jgi:hypothetical protein